MTYISTEVIEITSHMEFSGLFLVAVRFNSEQYKCRGLKT